jgi:putative membrane protein
LLFHPAEFETDLFPLYVLAAFLGGAVLTANSPLLRRLLSGRKALERSTKNAAAATFLELGVSRTSGRSGILVYLSLLEKRAVVVADIGLDATLLGPDFEQQKQRIDEAMATLEPKTVLAAIESLAPYLERSYPRMADDVNELPDEVNSV